MANKVLYLIGSLRNARVPALAKRLRKDFAAASMDVEVFDDWYAAGPEADDFWKTYEQERGRGYQEALAGHAAKNVFAFDKRNLDRSTHVLLVLPAGKSGHMEVMYGAYGVGAKAAILLDPEDVRWDVMYQFIPTILNGDGEIADWIKDDGERVLGSPGITAGGRQGAQSTLTGGRTPRLLSQCTCVGRKDQQGSGRQTSSGRAGSLGANEVNGSPQQDYAASD